MRFAQEYYTMGFWFIPVLVLFFVWALRRRRSLMRGFAEDGLLKDIASGVDLGRHRIKYSILVTAIIFSVLALARPQWGFQWREVKRVGLDILIAIDTSKSMLASDVKPNRLDRSKLAVKDLVRKLEGDRIGLIAFQERPSCNVR